VCHWQFSGSHRGGLLTLAHVDDVRSLWVIYRFPISTVISGAQTSFVSKVKARDGTCPSLRPMGNVKGKVWMGPAGGMGHYSGAMW
jgi:hypothetical protein